MPPDASFHATSPQYVPVAQLIEQGANNTKIIRADNQRAHMPIEMFIYRAEWG